MESFARLKHFAFGHNQSVRLLLASHVCQVFNGMKRYKCSFITDFVFYTTCFMLYFTSHPLKLAYTELCKRLRLEPFSHSISWRVSFVPNLLTEPPETLGYLRIIVMSEKNLKLDCKRHLALSHIFSLAPISL